MGMEIIELKVHYLHTEEIKLNSNAIAMLVVELRKPRQPD